MCWFEERSLSPGPAAPAVARRIVTQAIGQRVGTAHWVAFVQFDASLIASELVTNAIQAGAARLAVTVRVHRSRVRVTVSDDALGLPQIVSAGRDAVAGRGLTLVATVAREWGIDSGTIGKDVWADLGLAPQAFPAGPLSWCYEIDEHPADPPADVGPVGASATWTPTPDR